MDAQRGPPPRRRVAPVAVHRDCVMLTMDGVATDGVTLDISAANGFAVGVSTVDISAAGGSTENSGATRQRSSNVAGDSNNVVAF